MPLHRSQCYQAKFSEIKLKMKDQLSLSQRTLI